MLQKLIIIVSVYYIAYFLSQLLILQFITVSSKSLNFGKVLLQEILTYIVCIGEKFYKYGWNNLFWKFSVKEEYWSENLVISNRKKISYRFYKAKK